MARTVAVAALTVVFLLTIVGRTSAFLATQLNITDPDVANILCPDQTTGITRDHKWITREAIRRNIRQFFLDYPPPSQPSFNVPTTASLTELYHAYYGDAASPARFIKAVNTIAAGNVKADSAAHLKYNPDVQADAESFDGLQGSMASRYPQILTSILVNEAYPAARALLGLSIHSLQNFYSHSTWVEQGNTDILLDLGLPAFSGFENPAAADEDVCTPCTDPYGACTGNTIAGAGLTTGYYIYEEPDADGILVSKPTTGGKCSHGGVLDDSATTPAEGGINKDTASPCFSPHFQLHEQAAQLAVRATDYYLKVILDAVGEEKYRRLFDLYYGSALSILIDTTNSMDNSIEAVKNQVAEIVANSDPEIYILVPYNDPNVGPVTRTDNSDEFLAAVNSLSAGGGGDIPELFWKGLQLGLANTPDFGDIFAFTDAGGKDGENMQSDIAIAVDREISVTIVYSGDMVKERLLETGIPDYQYLADATGGLFIPSDKFSVAAITPILGESVESTNVDVTLLKNLTGLQAIEVPIDDSIFDFEVRLIGSLSEAVMKDINGKVYNLMDQASLEATPNVEVIVYTDSFLVIKWLDPLYGMWNLEINSASNYGVTVQANSTLSWLGGFSILDTKPPHPHYQETEGSPLMNTVYYLDVILIGYIESYVSDVSHVEYIDKTGLHLRTIPYNGDIDDEFYIRSDPLPGQPFYVKLYGHVQSGNVFCRLMQVMITPVGVVVEVIATSVDLSALAGYTAKGDFLVTNYGMESDFQVTGVDDKEYLTIMSPSMVHIATNESVVVTANFYVPPGENPGTVSTVTVTAQSVQEERSVNSAVTQFVVLGDEDVKSPLCQLLTTPDCTGYNYNGVCVQKNWTASASLHDDGSGISTIYVKPSGFQTVIDPFIPGTTDPIGVLHDSSCCISQAEIIGVDGSGNVGKCRIDMGTLGGYILDFEAIEVGITWVHLTWRITPTIFEVRKYTLVANNDISTDFPCHEATCYHNMSYLNPCELQTFKLTPVFDVDGVDRSGDPAFTEATTLGTLPGAPENGVVLNVTETTATVSWDASGIECFSHFKVCYHGFGLNNTKICGTTDGTSFTLTGLDPCAVYEVEIRSIAPSGQPSSESLVIPINTEEILPGAPKNMQAVLTTDDEVTLTWDEADHATCIDQYTVLYEETDKPRSSEVILTVKNTKDINLLFDHMVTIKPLDPCTDYTFRVAAVSKSGQIGPFAERRATTLEGDPGPVYTMDLMSINFDSMLVTWVPPTKCVDHFRVCYYDEHEAIENCQDVFDTQLTLTGLLSCTDYFVSVTVVTPSGIMSNSTWKSAETLEITPGEPTNLMITDVTSTSMNVYFDPPTTNAHCVSEYDFEMIDLELGTESSSSEIDADSRLDNVFSDLKSCTDYEARVRAVSEGGLPSAWVTVWETTLEEVPSEPRNLQSSAVTTTSVDLVWFEPEINGRCAYSYNLSWGSGSTVVAPPAGENLPFQVMTTVEGLTPCTSYTFTISAVTPAGFPSASASVDATTSCE